MPTPSARALGFVLALATPSLLAACAWSVPADPGRNAAERTRPATPPPPSAARVGGAPAFRAADDATRALYEERCGRCHAPFDPRHATPDQWPGLVRRYGPRAGLFGEERARVLAWLVARAR